MIMISVCRTNGRIISRYSNYVHFNLYMCLIRINLMMVHLNLFLRRLFYYYQKENTILNALSVVSNRFNAKKKIV